MANEKALPLWQSMMRNDDFQGDLARIYNDTFVRTLARMAGPSANLGDLRNGIEAGARAYLLVRRNMARRKPGKMEARRLEPIANAAYSLQSALDRIESSPNPRLRLMDALDELALSETGPGANLIREIEKKFGPGDPLRVLDDTIRLLALAAAQTVNKTPGQADDDRFVRHAALYDTELAAWDKRARKTETQPIIALAKAFRPFWQRNSEHPYTEGMYDKKQRRTLSPAVDAVHRIGLQLDSKLQRKRVVTAFRTLPPA